MSDRKRKYALSEEGRAAISAAQVKRHEQYRQRKAAAAARKAERAAKRKASKEAKA